MRGTLFGLACALLWASEAGAGVLFTYNFAGLSGAEAKVAATAGAVPPGATASDLTRSAALTPAAGKNSINSSGWTTALTPDPNDYYQFTVTPGAGGLNLSELDFTARRSKADGPTGFEVRFSTNGFASSTPIALEALNPASDANFREMIGLSGVSALQGVTAPVTFRILAFGATLNPTNHRNDGTFRLGIDAGSANSNLPPNLVLSGIAATPEPSTLVMASVGAVGLVGFARLRRRAA